MAYQAYPVKGAGGVDVGLACGAQARVQLEVTHAALNHGDDLFLAVSAEAVVIAVLLEALLDLKGIA